MHHVPPRFCQNFCVIALSEHNDCFVKKTYSPFLLYVPQRVYVLQYDSSDGQISNPNDR